MGCQSSWNDIQSYRILDKLQEVDQMETSPPFTKVSFDAFGPWENSTRRLRGGEAIPKPRALICTCLSSGAIHIEVLETMDTNLFNCALGWFFTIRGSVTKLIHVCDHSSSFVGGKSQLEQALSEMDQTQVQKFVAEQGWIFNPPHASHFGHVWEQQIGTV